MAALLMPGSAKPSTAEPQPTGNSGFFAHHGIWAPGVRLFRLFTFRTKAVLIMLAMAVPIAVLGTVYFREHLEVMRTTGLERQGVVYANAVAKLLQAMGEYERLSLEQASRPSDAAGAGSSAALAALQKDFAQVQDLEATLGPTLETSKAFAKARDALKALAAPSSGVSKVYATNRILGLALNSLIVAVSDGSGLMLDPDLDTYYLMDVGVLRLPITSERLGRLTALAAAVDATGQGGDIAALELNRLDTLIDLETRGIVSGTVKVIHEHPDSKTALDAAPLKKLFERLRESATDTPGTGGVAKARELDRQGQETANAAWSTQSKAVSMLDDLLGQRVQATIDGFWLVGAVTLAFVCLAAYLFLSFYKVMDGGLKETRRHLRAMTEGDLTTSPHPWGHDEAAQLMLELRAMQDSLRGMVLRVRGASDEIVHSSGEIASGAMDLSSRTEQAAANLEESAASMEQITSTVKNGSDSTEEAARVARHNAEVAAEGGRAMHEVEQTMEGIRSASAKIGEIIGTIDGIAFQTNILALNAAVEAARAGEQGRGFAVVASEVRMLAKRSGEAARQIKTLIGSSVNQVEAGTSTVRQAGAKIDDIVSSSKRVDQLLGEIAHGAREQTLGIGQVGQAVQELDRMTQQNAALVEQTASAATAMRDQALALAEEVSRFRVPDGRLAAATASASVQGQEFDFGSAIEAHRQWKVRLRKAIADHEKLDAEKICRDDQCPLGKWIHGPGGARWGSKPVFVNLLHKHAEFHKAAAAVARKINSGQFDEADRLIGSGSTFADCSIQVSTLLTQAKREL